MLKVGLTGGIAAGKSVAAARLAALGAVLIDADVLSREVVMPGTDGLRALVEAFGDGILTDAGELDRPALGDIVFNDPAQRDCLNAIVHPRVRERAAELEKAGEGRIVVQDIPLLVETGQSPSFHLVIVVDAPDDERLRRMVEDRGMSAADARSRMAAQASAAERNAGADVVLLNTGSRDQLLAAVDELWEDRLLPFHQNLVQSRPAESNDSVQVSGGPARLSELAALLSQRIMRADSCIAAVDRMDPPADSAAADALHLLVTVRDREDVDAVEGALAAVGFPRCLQSGRVKSGADGEDSDGGTLPLHCNADPGRSVRLHFRVAGSDGEPNCPGEVLPCKA